MHCDRSTNKKVHWNENFDQTGKLVVGYVKVFSDNTALTMRSTGLQRTKDKLIAELFLLLPAVPH